MFAKAVVCVVLLVCLGTGVTSQNTCTVSLEAENGTGGRYMYRSNASGGISVLLFEHEQLVHDNLVFRSEDNLCSLQLFGIRYGKSGQIEAFLNGTSLGSVTTPAESDSGVNMFQTVEMPSKLRMFEGKYIVKLFVIEADPNGIEIDKCLLQFECSNKCSLDTFRKNKTESNNERSLDTNENKSGEDDLLNVHGTNGTNSIFDFTTAEKIGIGIAASLVAILGAAGTVSLTCYCIFGGVCSDTHRSSSGHSSSGRTPHYGSTTYDNRNPDNSIHVCCCFNQQ
jgi:hypothetical protein